MFVYAYQSVTNVIIADGVTRISQNCFAGCKSLQSVTIPVNVTQIGNSSFADCTNLARVELPNDVGTLTVGADAFNNGTIVEVQERIGYTVYWTNTLGEVVADPFHKNVGENFACYAEQCNATVVATGPTIPFPLPKRDDHAPQQVRWKLRFRHVGKGHKLSLRQLNLRHPHLFRMCRKMFQSHV